MISNRTVKKMPDNLWKALKGVMRPVPLDAIVEVMLTDGSKIVGPAGSFEWSRELCDENDYIVAYRVIGYDDSLNFDWE